MTFCEKLLVLRKNKGLTQEELAERVTVSRQAIAKWESGQAYPDIANLIALSEFFHVTIDQLVKDDDGCQMSPVHKESCETGELVDFLLRAKRATYAAKQGACAPCRPDSHDFCYEQGEYRYLDTYLGGECFSGQEAVWKNGAAVYAMNYCGRVISSAFCGDFLKAALMAVPRELPFRGPLFYQENDSLYNCKVCGTPEWYQGCEEILYKNARVYEAFFHGGLLK